MYGTIARMRVRPGKLEQLRSYMEVYRDIEVPGALMEFVYQTDEDPNVVYLAVLFESRESYWENARSPEQDARYREMLPFLDGEPEWHDGEVVFASTDITELARRQGTR